MIVLDAPSNLGLRAPERGGEPGASRLADALRACDLVARLGAADAGRVDAPPWVDLMTNRAAIPAYTSALSERLGALLDDRVVMLGGDCSILLGAMLALRRRGRNGLVFVDGHLDFRHAGWSSGVGAVAGEDLAVVTGRAEDALADIDGLRPYVVDADVLALGERERDPGEREAVAETGISVVDLWAVRAGEFAVPSLPYWIHVDADVIDSALLPAVDSPAPDGLSFDELTVLLRALVAGPWVGMDVTVFDPDLDPDGSQAAALTDCLVSALR